MGPFFVHRVVPEERDVENDWREVYGIVTAPTSKGRNRVRQKQESIPELPAESHPFFLLPEHEKEVVPGQQGGKSILTRYREVGSGPPVLLLHGLWTSAYTFRHLIEPLSPSFRLIMPELIDPEGVHLLPGGDYHPHRLAGWMAGLMDSFGIQSPLVVAHGECGLAALLLGLRQPDRMRGLITVGTSTGLPALLGIKGRFRAQPWMVKRWARAGFKRPIQAALAMLDYADPAVVCRQEIRRLARRWSSLPAAMTTAGILAQTLSPSYRRDFQHVLQHRPAESSAFPAPLKLLIGQLDRLASPAHGEKINRAFPGSELLVAEGCGGTLQVEKPDWTADIILSAGTQ
jgi:pimeloyl-ACP methyl ester carboxylesterase